MFLARCIPSILPQLTMVKLFEITKIYSVAECFPLMCRSFCTDRSALHNTPLAMSSLSVMEHPMSR